MNIGEQAFRELFVDKELTRTISVSYSGKFKSYNANVRYTKSDMNFQLSKEWKKISDEIQIGLIQTLLVKVYKSKGKKTINMDLYDHFIKSMANYAKVDEIDPTLEKSFDRVNEKYFDGLMEKPNLKWTTTNFSRMGYYEYGSNTVTISRVLEEDEELLDYVVYHELLHKKHKFNTNNGRSHHHTKNFRLDERKFDNPIIEKKLHDFLRRRKYSFRVPKKTKEDTKQKKSSLLDWFFR